MKITPDLFEAFLKCPTKCWLRASGEPTSGNAYADWVKSQGESYRGNETARLAGDLSNGDVATSPDVETLKSAKWRLATGVVAQAPVNSCVVESVVHAIERIPSQGRGRAAQFIPIRFIFRNKLTKDDKLLLAFDAFVLAQAMGRDTSIGKIIHGDRTLLPETCIRARESAANSGEPANEQHATPESVALTRAQPLVTKVKTPALTGEVRKRLEKTAALLASEKPPDLVLNRHCPECEFRDRCRQKAIEADDLSLLAGMSAKERQKLRSKGIFTVTQFSYTFRPRRRPRRLRDKREKYHHALKALAIREQKIHIVGSPELKIEGTPVYLDIEGLPDRDFYYLIGLRIGHGDTAVQHSLWADTVADEGKIWREFLAILETVEKPVLIHYGSYETEFLKRMCACHGVPGEAPAPQAKAIPAAVNLLSGIFGQVYFPTFSNGLKEIAGHLGFGWTEAAATGLQTIERRHEWATSRAPFYKSSLLTYNAEDCNAVEVVANKLLELHRASSEGQSSPQHEVVDVAKLKREHPYGFKRNTFAFPELNVINDAAYWDYQRERVYVKSNANLRRALTRPQKSRKAFAPNKTINCSRPRTCPKCASRNVVKHTKSSKTVLDIKFMRHGIKRWITRHRFHRYLCQKCGAVFQPKETCWGKSKFGSELVAYFLYLNIELRLPQIHVASNLNRLFGFRLDSANTGNFKARAAKKYKETYHTLVKKLCSGRLLHADETKVNLRDKDGFVWVFANMEEVAYVYSETREGDLLQTMLKDFRGVLISDFYAAYDGIPCPQQKCLIHLIRDLNDDLLKYPYNEELRRLTQAFVALLKPMVETIDRRGLKTRFLRKHAPSVERFYRQISETTLQSEAAVKFKDRLEKNRDKLFTFLRFDGVPWNNNNAEHAVKPFAALRQIIGGITTEKGLQDYLVLLSVCQTCKYMGVDFLDFLRSGEKDIHAFAASRRGRRQRKETSPPTGSAAVALPEVVATTQIAPGT